VCWKLLLYTLFYKLKVGITSFIFRILLRRVLARAALRSAIPLVAIPAPASTETVSPNLRYRIGIP
jgi:hypothetical protein